MSNKYAPDRMVREGFNHWGITRSYKSTVDLNKDIKWTTYVDRQRFLDALEIADAAINESIEWCEMGCVERPSISEGRLTLIEVMFEAKEKLKELRG